MIVYFWHKSKVILWGAGSLGLLCLVYALFVHGQILKMDHFTLQVIKKRDLEIADHDAVKETQVTLDHAFVASKRGKYYYPVLCNRAKTLSIYNMLYFKDKMAAEAAGYMPFSGC